MFVNIPVTPFTKKCLIHEFGNEIKAIHQHSTLFQNLSKVTFSFKKEKVKALCTETVEVKVSKKLANHIQSTNIFKLGYMLHSYELEKLFNTVFYAVYFNKKEAMTTISNYLQLRNVSEDDFAQRTVYRAWQRYEAQKVGNSAKNRAKIKQSYDARFQPIHHELILRDLLVCFDLDIGQLKGSILKNNELHQKRKVILFLMYKLSKITLAELSKIFLFSFQKIHIHIKDLEFTYCNFQEDSISISINNAFEHLNEALSPLVIHKSQLGLLHDKPSHTDKRR